MQCSNNLKQIGLALHNYHDVYQRLPYGSHPSLETAHWNWQPRILAFMEMSPLQNKLDFRIAARDGANYDLVREPQAAFLCPSDPTAREYCTEESFADTGDGRHWLLSQSDYAGCLGDYHNDTGVGQDPAYGNVWAVTGKWPSETRGMISRYGWGASFRDVTDGLSNTFCVGECIGSLCIIQNFASQCVATTAHPINYMNQSLMASRPTASNARWDEAIGFRSFHPGGALFLLGDASVRFVSDTIDGVAYRAAASRAGSESTGMQ
jgi:hypothetical protein